ncbi:HNH endonuclease [Streptomyces jumonjinensis]|uniref:HNH endonuclease n=1 Tax=Streptomyces jumonjinensis TaxID=1945 RepID=A0A646KEC4_STRJU|nr:HNH endonuclease [Streptomyces jumonjinensis]MQS99375.1 HNH endonuclease [Streptomyces jumonjinensis]
MRSPAWSRDELVLACALVVKNGWRELREGDQAVQELSELLRSLPLHDGIAQELPQYRSVGSVSHKTTDLATNHPSYTGKPTKGGSLDKAVIADFIAREAEMLAAAQAIEEGVSSGELVRLSPQPDEVDEDGTTASEGRLLARWALSRERDPKLRRRKLAQVRKSGTPLQCEVCAFHFERTYGELGQGYIEVHHVLPLHISGPRETKLADLALLCANCHRMCHKSHRGASWRTPADVREEMADAARHGSSH